MHIAAEKLVKVTDVVEPGQTCNFAHAPLPFLKQFSRLADSVTVEVFNNGHIHIRFENTAQVPHAQVKLCGNQCEGDMGGVVAL